MNDNLVAEMVEKYRELIKEAYREGWEDGARSGMYEGGKGNPYDLKEIARIRRKHGSPKK